MRNRYIIWGIYLMAALLFSSSLFAQTIYYSPSSGGGRTKEALAAAAADPRPATYDKHDLSGIWYGGKNPRVFSRTPPPFTPEGKKRFDANKPSFGPRAVIPALGNDPIGRCDPLGFPRNLWVAGRSFEIVQSPSKYIQTFEWTRAFREIWTGKQRIPEDPDPRWYGWAVGHWDGDTFVVDSKGYDDKTWVDDLGYPHSENMALQERWNRVDYETLELVMTLTDPEIYTKPWVSAKQTYKLQLPKETTIMGEDFCVPSENEFFNENVRNLAGTGTAHPTK